MPSKETIHRILEEADTALRTLEDSQVSVVDAGLRRALLDLEAELQREYTKAAEETSAEDAKKREARAKSLLKQTETLLEAFKLGGPGGLTDTVKAGIIAAQQDGIETAEAALETYGDYMPFQGTFDPRSVISAVKDSNLRWSKHSGEFIQRVQEHVISGLIRGKPLAGVAARLREETGILGSKARLLIRTETLNARDHGQRRGYSASGIQFVQRLATMDTRVCPYCAYRHGKIYPIGSAPAVIHGHDRCTNMPFRPEWVDEGVVNLEAFENERQRMMVKTGGGNPGLAPFERNRRNVPQRHYSPPELQAMVEELAVLEGVPPADDKRIRQRLRAAEEALARADYTRVATILTEVEGMQPNPRLAARVEGIRTQLREKTGRPPTTIQPVIPVPPPVQPVVPVPPPVQPVILENRVEIHPPIPTPTSPEIRPDFMEKIDKFLVSLRAGDWQNVISPIYLASFDERKYNRPERDFLRVLSTYASIERDREAWWAYERYQQGLNEIPDGATIATQLLTAMPNLPPHDYSNLRAPVYHDRRKLLDDILARPTPSSESHFIRISPEVQSDLTPAQLQAVDTAIAEFHRLIPPALLASLPPVTLAMSEEGRAYYDRDRHIIGLTHKTSVLQVLHELGHHLERNHPQLLNHVMSWRAQRTRGEYDRPLREIIPGSHFGGDEVASPDKFFHPYVGKDNGGGGTEVFTMGLEEIWRDPVSFATVDPDHFSLIWDLISGRGPEVLRPSVKRPDPVFPVVAPIPVIQPTVQLPPSEVAVLPPGGDRRVDTRPAVGTETATGGTGTIPQIVVPLLPPVITATPRTIPESRSTIMTALTRTRVNLTGIDTVAADQLATQIPRLVQLIPGLKDVVKSIRLVDMPIEQGIAAYFPHTREFGLSQHFFSDPSRADEQVRKWRAENYIQRAGNTIEAVVTHELAHALEVWLKENNEGLYYDLISNFFSADPTLSTYSTANQSEYFAENFTNWFLSTAGTAHPQAAEFGRRLSEGLALPPISPPPGTEVPTPTRVDPVSYPPIKQDEDAFEAWGARYAPEGTEQQIAAIELYTHKGDNVVNERLRHGTREYAEANQVEFTVDQEIALTRYLDQKPLEAPVLLYRGMKVPQFLYDLGVGGVFQDKGFASTSIDRSVALAALEGEGLPGALLEIEADIGTKGAYIERYSDHVGEFEYLLQRGATFTVLEIDDSGIVPVIRVRVNNGEDIEETIKQVERAEQVRLESERLERSRQAQEEEERRRQATTTTTTTRIVDDKKARQHLRAAEAAMVDNDRKKIQERLTILEGFQLPSSLQARFNSIQEFLGQKPPPAITPPPTKPPEIIAPPTPPPAVIPAELTAKIEAIFDQMRYEGLDQWTAAARIRGLEMFVHPDDDASNKKLNELYNMLLESEELPDYLKPRERPVPPLPPTPTVPNEVKLGIQNARDAVETGRMSLVEAQYALSRLRDRFTDPAILKEIDDAIHALEEVKPPPSKPVNPEVIAAVQYALNSVIAGTMSQKTAILDIEGLWLTYDLTVADSAYIADAVEKIKKATVLKPDPSPEAKKFVDDFLKIVANGSMEPTTVIRRLQEARSRFYLPADVQLIADTITDLEHEQSQVHDQIRADIEMGEAALDQGTITPGKLLEKFRTQLENAREGEHSLQTIRALERAIARVQQRVDPANDPEDQKVSPNVGQQVEKLLDDLDDGVLSEKRLLAKILVLVATEGDSMTRGDLKYIEETIRKLHPDPKERFKALRELFQRYASNAKNLILQENASQATRFAERVEALAPTAGKGDFIEQARLIREKLDILTKGGGIGPDFKTKIQSLTDAIEKKRWASAEDLVKVSLNSLAWNRQERAELERLAQNIREELTKLAEKRAKLTQDAHRMYPAGAEARRRIMEAAQAEGLSITNRPYSVRASVDAISRQLLLAELEIESRRTTQVDLQIDPAVFNRFTPSGQTSVRQGVTAWRRLIPFGLIEDYATPVLAIGTEDRGSYSSSGNLVNLSKGTSLATTIHELGHHVEYAIPGLAARCREFVERRTRGEEPVKLTKLFPGSSYDPSETTKPDKFIHPYVGKTYEVSTEVISVGLEEMWRDPVGFALADPEHFDIIWDVITGRV